MGNPMVAVVVFDGECGLCHRGVAFIARRDRERRFRFAASGSPAGEALLTRVGMRDLAASTLVLLEGERVSLRSDAALRIARGLRAPWPAVAGVGRLLPRPVRDAAYRLVARNRHRFGHAPGACGIPAPEVRERLLSDPDEALALLLPHP